MLYALFCHQFKPNCNKFRPDPFPILLRVSYLWHSITSAYNKNKFDRLNLF